MRVLTTILSLAAVLLLAYVSHSYGFTQAPSLGALGLLCFGAGHLTGVRTTKSVLSKRSKSHLQRLKDRTNAYASPAGVQPHSAYGLRAGRNAFDAHEALRERAANSLRSALH